MSKPRWSARLSTPLALRDGQTLRALSDARALILGLPAADQERQAWMKATELLMEAAASGGNIQAATDAIFFALFLQANLRLE